MLTGERPFAGEDTTTVMLKISRDIHPSPRLYNPKIPRVVEKIVDRALEKDLKKRYQTAGQLANHLKKVVTKIDELRKST
jgi:serine/threonine-protein kinase